MLLTEIIGGAFLVSMGNANAVLLDVDGDMVLIDAGFPGKADRVLAAIGRLGRRPSDLKHIVFTHAHQAACFGHGKPIVKSAAAQLILGVRLRDVEQVSPRICAHDDAVRCWGMIQDAVGQTLSEYSPSFYAVLGHGRPMR